MLDMTQKPIFEKKKFFGKCRIVPKTLKIPLCSQHVSFLVKVEGALLRTNRKKIAYCRKHGGLKKKQNSDIACWFTEKS